MQFYATTKMNSLSLIESFENLPEEKRKDIDLGHFQHDFNINEDIKGLTLEHLGIIFKFMIVSFGTIIGVFIGEIALFIHQYCKWKREIIKRREEKKRRLSTKLIN